MFIVVIAAAAGSPNTDVYVYREMCHLDYRSSSSLPILLLFLLFLLLLLYIFPIGMLLIQIAKENLFLPNQKWSLFVLFILNRN
jgi:hypothetical protein